MKKILIAVLIASAAAGSTQSFAATDESIRQVFSELDRCLSTNDAKCVGELMADNATFAAPMFGTKIIKGKAQIVESLEEMMGIPAPNMKGVKRRHTVGNVREIGADHAVVDASVAVEGMKSPEGVAADGPWTHHAVAVMTLKAGEWLFQDLRSYVVEPANKTAPPAGAANKTAPPAAPANEPAPPAKN